MLTRGTKGGTRSVNRPDRHSRSHLGGLLADLAVQLGLGAVSERWRGPHSSDPRHPAPHRTALISYARVGRVVRAAVPPPAGAPLLSGLLSRRRPPPVPVVRCPIHGI